MSRRAAALAAILVTLTIGAPSVADADMLADPTPPASADIEEMVDRIIAQREQGAS